MDVLAKGSEVDDIGSLTKVKDVMDVINERAC